LTRGRKSAGADVARPQDSDWIVELFAAFQPVTVRRMFGGAGIFVEGTMFALIDEGVIFLKADEGTISDFKREGLGPFTYSTKAGTRSLTSYWRIPGRLYDEPDELALWAARALEAARRAAAPSSRRGSRAASKPVTRLPKSR
jgi:DNA transformation protein